MKDILKARKEKLQRAYKLNPQLTTYARLREVTLLLNKLYQHDARTSVKDTGSAKRGDTPELQQHLSSPSPDGGHSTDWVVLTDDEISACSKGNMTRSGFARTVEAKLREKNT